MKKVEFSEDTLNLLNQRIGLFVMDVRINIEQSEFQYPSSVMGKLHFFGDEIISDAKKLKKIFKIQNRSSIIKNTVIDIGKMLSLLSVIENDLKNGFECDINIKKQNQSKIENALDFLLFNLRKIDLMFLQFIETSKDLIKEFDEHVYVAKQIKSEILLIDFSYRVDFITILNHRLDLFSSYDVFFKAMEVRVKERSVDINIMIKSLVEVRSILENKMVEEYECIEVCDLLKKMFILFDNKIGFMFN